MKVEVGLHSEPTVPIKLQLSNFKPPTFNKLWSGRVDGFDCMIVVLSVEPPLTPLGEPPERRK